MASTLVDWDQKQVNSTELAWIFTDIYSNILLYSYIHIVARVNNWNYAFFTELPLCLSKTKVYSTFSQPPVIILTDYISECTSSIHVSLSCSKVWGEVTPYQCM